MYKDLRSVLDIGLAGEPGECRVYQFGNVADAGVFLRQLSAKFASACKSNRRAKIAETNDWPGVFWRRHPEDPTAVIVGKRLMPLGVKRVVMQPDGQLKDVDKWPSEVANEEVVE